MDETRNPASKPLVGIVMGSKTDKEILDAAGEILKELGISYEMKIISAHRAPDRTIEYAATAEGRGIEVLIAAAGGAAALPGVISAKTILPVLGVPIAATPLGGLDALLSISQMPKGVPVGTLAIGKWGAANAALLAAAILGGSHREIRESLRAWRKKRTDEALAGENGQGRDPRFPVRGIRSGRE